MIKTETCALAQKRHDIYKRNAKAKAYSRKQSNNKVIKVIGGVVLASLFLIGAGLIGASDVETAKAEGNYNNGNYETESETTITESTQREMEAVLVDIDEQGRYILQTVDGNQWAIQDPPEVYYNITIDDNGTADNFEDDIIVGLE